MVPAKAGDAGSIPRLGRSFGGGNGNPLQCLAWKIPWTEEPGGLYPQGHKELDTIERLNSNNMWSLSTGIDFLIFLVHLVLRETAIGSFRNVLSKGLTELQTSPIYDLLRTNIPIGPCYQHRDSYTRAATPLAETISSPPGSARSYGSEQGHVTAVNLD